MGVEMSQVIYSNGLCLIDITSNKTPPPRGMSAHSKNVGAYFREAMIESKSR